MYVCVRVHIIGTYIDTYNSVCYCLMRMCTSIFFVYCWNFRYLASSVIMFSLYLFSACQQECPVHWPGFVSTPVIICYSYLQPCCLCHPSHGLLGIAGDNAIWKSLCCFWMSSAVRIYLTHVCDEFPQSFISLDCRGGQYPPKEADISN